MVMQISTSPTTRYCTATKRSTSTFTKLLDEKPGVGFPDNREREALLRFGISGVEIRVEGYRAAAHGIRPVTYAVELKSDLVVKFT